MRCRGDTTRVNEDENAAVRGVAFVIEAGAMADVPVAALERAKNVSSETQRTAAPARRPA